MLSMVWRGQAVLKAPSRCERISLLTWEVAFSPPHLLCLLPCSLPCSVPQRLTLSDSISLVHLLAWLLSRWFGQQKAPAGQEKEFGGIRFLCLPCFYITSLAAAGSLHRHNSCWVPSLQLVELFQVLLEVTVSHCASLWVPHHPCFLNNCLHLCDRSFHLFETSGVILLLLPRC